MAAARSPEASFAIFSTWNCGCLGISTSSERTANTPNPERVHETTVVHSRIGVLACGARWTRANGGQREREGRWRCEHDRLEHLRQVHAVELRWCNPQDRQHERARQCRP